MTEILLLLAGVTFASLARPATESPIQSPNPQRPSEQETAESKKKQAQENALSTPNSAVAWFELGQQYRKGGDKNAAAAAEAYQRAIRLKPDYVEAYKGLAWAFGSQGRYEWQVDALRRSIELNPNDAVAYFQLGEAHFAFGVNSGRPSSLSSDKPGSIPERLKQYAQLASEAYEHAVRIRPEYASAHTGLGSAYAILQRFEEATRAYQRAIECDPKDPMIRIRFGYVYLLKPDYEAALAQHQAAVRLIGDVNDVVLRGTYRLAAMMLFEEIKEWLEDRARVAEGQKMGEPCEIVARVNEGFITQADYSAALEEYRAELSHRSRNGLNKIDLEIERRKPEIIQSLIDDLLLEQRAKELGIKDEDQDRVIHPGYYDPLARSVYDEALKNKGIDPKQAQASLSGRKLRESVIQREVLKPIMQSITDEERRDYFNQHKEEFMLPMALSLSEIFLPFDGSPETAIEQRASEILARLRAGADFLIEVEENTPRSRPSFEKGGHLGLFVPTDLREEIAKAVKPLNPGEFTEPIRLTEGYLIVRLDERRSATLPRYDDPNLKLRISRSITMLRAERARRDYLTQLRGNADIELCPSK